MKQYSALELLFGGVSVAVFPASYALIYLQQDRDWMCFSDSCIDGSSMAPLVRKDLGIFYLLLLLTLVAIAAGKKYSAIGNFYSMRISKTSLTTIAELGWFIIVLLALASSFAWDFNFWWFRRIVRWTSRGSPVATLVPQTFFNASGDVLTVIMGFVILPVSKNSFLATFLNLPYTNLIRLHIWFGRLLLWGSVFHATVGIGYYVTQNRNLVNTLFIVAAGSVYGNGRFQQVTGVAAFVVLAFVSITSIDYFRRHFYNTFFWTHFFVFAFIVLTYIHASSSIFFMIPGLCLYTIDGFIRLSSRITPDSVISVIYEQCGYITVTVATKKARNAQSGQFMRVNIPSVSQTEFHPWSIVRSTDTSMTFMFSAGINKCEWSAQVGRKLESLGKTGYGTHAKEKIVVNLQGPYGKKIGITSKKHDIALFYVGGTGVAASVQAIDSVLARNDADTEEGKTKVVLVWSARRNHIADISILQPWRGISKDMLELELVETSGNSTANVKEENALLMSNARADLMASLKRLISSEAYSINLSIGVFICGPGGFTKAALTNVSEFSAENPGIQVVVEVESFDL